MANVPAKAHGNNFQAKFVQGPPNSFVSVPLKRDGGFYYPPELGPCPPIRFDLPGPLEGKMKINIFSS
jgi:hypothetical protein